MKKALLLAISFGFLYSCAKAPPKTAGIPRPVAQAQTLLDHYRRKPPINSLSAYADATVTFRGKREFLSAAVLAQSPDRLHIELINDLGESLGRLISDGKTVTWWESRTDETLTFSLREPALQKAFRLPLSVEDFIARLLLRLPEEEIADFQELSEPEGGLRIDRRTDRLTFEKNSTSLKSYEKKKKEGSDSPLYRVTYGYSSLGSRAFPEQMLWKFFKPRFQMSLKLREISVNGNIAPAKFSLLPERDGQNNQ